jgi:DNA gyrase inhibitor GyrI
MKRSMILAVLASVALLPVSAWAEKAPAPPPAPEAPKAPAEPAPPEVTVKTVEPMLALVVPMKGSYLQHEAAFGQLFGALGTLGVAPAGPPFGRYFDDADQVAEADLRWELGFPISAKAEVAAPFEVKEIPGGLMAVVVQEGPYEASVQGAFATAMGWLPTSGYQVVDAPMAFFLGDMMSGTDVRAEVRLPVEKVE